MKYHSRYFGLRLRHALYNYIGNGWIWIHINKYVVVTINIRSQVLWQIDNLTWVVFSSEPDDSETFHQTLAKQQLLFSLLWLHSFYTQKCNNKQFIIYIIDFFYKMEANGQNTTRSAQIKELYVFNSKFGNDTDNVRNQIHILLLCTHLTRASFLLKIFIKSNNS